MKAPRNTHAAGWLLSIAATLSGCEALDSLGADDAAAGQTDGEFAAGGAGGGAGGGESGGWRIEAHPCVGNRTDTLWADPDDTLWVGCGSTTVGTGLYRSEDGGRTWAAPTTEPGGYFDRFRVSSVSRSADDLLYVAGTLTSGDARVVALDTRGAAPYPVAPALRSTSQLWNSFHVGTFRRSASGRAVSESLTGGGLAWRPDDATDFADGDGWPTDGASYQILDLDERDGDFYGVGSTITQPPTVFLPPAAPVADRFTLDPLTLADVRGELWGVAAGDTLLVAGGVDQDRASGLVFVTERGPGAHRRDAWRAYSVADARPDASATWIRGVCTRGARVFAVGEYSRRSTGLILMSTDAGGSFTDVTPEQPNGRALPAMHRCQIPNADRAVFAGANGVFAEWTAPR